MAIAVDDLGLYRVFQRVAARRSFTAAAAELRLELSGVSRKVARLEELLGVRLFHRSTRRVSLTAEGQALLEKIGVILEDLSELEGSFAPRTAPNGVVRVACLPWIGHRILAEPLIRFGALHPGIRFELSLSDRLVDLVDEQVDVAIRVDEPGGAGLVYRKLFPNSLLFCASPGYMKAIGRKLKTPKDLGEHAFFAIPEHLSVKFVRSGRPVSEFAPPISVSCGSGLFTTELALRGAGVILRSRGDVEPFLGSGQLVEVLEKHRVEDYGDVFVVTAEKRFLNPRVRMFVEFLQRELKGPGAEML